MPRITSIKAVNKGLADAGMPFELVKGEGYFYFAALDDSTTYQPQSIYACHWTHQRPETWASDLAEAIKQWKEHEQ